MTSVNLTQFMASGASYAFSKRIRQAFHRWVLEKILHLLGRAELLPCPELLGGSRFRIGTPYRRRSCGAAPLKPSAQPADIQVGLPLWGTAFNWNPARFQRRPQGRATALWDPMGGMGPIGHIGHIGHIGPIGPIGQAGR